MFPAWDMWEVLMQLPIIAECCNPQFCYVSLQGPSWKRWHKRKKKWEVQLRTGRNPNFLSLLQIAWKYPYVWVSIPSWSASKGLKNIQRFQWIQRQQQRHSNCLELWGQALCLFTAPFEAAFVGDWAVIPVMLPFLGTLLDTHLFSVTTVPLICKTCYVCSPTDCSHLAHVQPFQDHRADIFQF